MDNLKQYKNNITSQWGEDGIIEEIFKRIGCGNKFCVEFGAWDGKHYSNVWNLWHEKEWGALLIEGDTKKCENLKRSTEKFKKVTAHCAYVEPKGTNSLDEILHEQTKQKDVDLLCIDIDGNDYYIFESLQIKPRVIVIEYNPTIPPFLNLIQKPGEYLGASARAFCELAHKKGYRLATITETNLFFVREDEFKKIGFEEPTLENIFIPDHLTYIVTSYDGVPFATKNPTYATLSKSQKRIRYFADPQTLFPVVIKRRQDFPVTLKRYATKIPIKEVRSLLKKTQLYPIYQNVRTILKTSRNIAIHKKKELIVRQYQRRFNINTLVETGTYLGEMISAMRTRFKRIYSIELSHKLASAAQKKFAQDKHITILEGDSEVMLKKILKELKSPALFWLDGHYSGGITAKGALHTPIRAELEEILSHPISGHVVLIDDARCFDGTNDYPTIAELTSFILNKNKKLKVKISSDIIQIHS